MPEWKVAVNGVPVDGEMLAGRTFAVVTRRDPGKEHSYLMFFEGDVDATADTGRVIDCRTWIAPRLPILIETRSYPKCQDRLYDTTHNPRMALTAKGGVTQFRTMQGDVISMRQQ